jgi:TPR repeat protein
MNPTIMMNWIVCAGSTRRMGETYYSDKETGIIKRGYISYNPETAYSWFHPAARVEKPVAHSQYMLAAMHEQGIGCVKNIEEAMYRYTQPMNGDRLYDSPREDQGDD